MRLIKAFWRGWKKAFREFFEVLRGYNWEDVEGLFEGAGDISGMLFILFSIVIPICLVLVLVLRALGSLLGVAG